MLGCVQNEARYFVKPDGIYNREVLGNMSQVLGGSKSDEVMDYFDRSQLPPYEALDKLFTTAI